MREAMRLNPYHPEWYWVDLGSVLYAAHCYEEALEAFKHRNRPGTLVLARLAACYAQLGRMDEARRMVAELLLVSSSVLHLLKGLDQPETFITGAIAIALLACRAEFDVAGDPASRLPALVWSGVFLLGTYLYGAGALFVNRSLVDQPWSPGFAVAATTRALLGLGVHPSPGVRPPFGTWFPLSVGLLVASRD